MEAAVEQCSVDKKYFDIQKKEFFLDNDRLLEHIIYHDVMNIVMHADSVSVNVLPANNKCRVHDNLVVEQLEQENDHLFELLLSQDIFHICVNSFPTRNNCRDMQLHFIHEYNENLVLKAELTKKEHMDEKKVFDEVLLRCSRLENRSANLELKLQHQKETKLDAKHISIAKLKKHIKNLKGKNVVGKDATPNNTKIIAPGMFKLNLQPLSPKVLKNRDAHIYYIKHSRKHDDNLQEIVEHAKAPRPLASDLDSVCKNTSASRSQPLGNTKKYRISRTTSSNMVNKVEDHPRSIKYSSNKMNHVVEPVVQIVLWYLDSRCSKDMTGNCYQLINFVHKFLGIVIFGNDQIAKIIGYGDLSDGKCYDFSEAVVTTCYTQNRSLIRKLHNKTPYELLHDKKHDLSYIHVFDAQCFPTNDSEDLGKLIPKADIGIFVGYAPAKKAYRIYNKRTHLIIETIHLDFDELIEMASEQFGSGPGP
ncbi:retrovirus-related pol polyprotein from transposon TNT 1-94 [Tanacetum coccineum]